MKHVTVTRQGWYTHVEMVGGEEHHTNIMTESKLKAKVNNGVCLVTAKLIMVCA